MKGRLLAADGRACEVHERRAAERVWQDFGNPPVVTLQLAEAKQPTRDSPPSGGSHDFLPGGV